MVGFGFGLDVCIVLLMVCIVVMGFDVVVNVVYVNKIVVIEDDVECA